MIDELNVRLLRTAENMVSWLDRTYEITHKLESENASRVVWLVALSGFAIINAPSLISQNISVSAFIPWTITALAGVIAHWLHRHVAIENLSLYIAKRESLIAYIINNSNNPTFNDLQLILNNKTDTLEKISKKVSRISDITTVMELFTFASFAVSLIYFIWTMVNLNKFP